MRDRIRAAVLAAVTLAMSVMVAAPTTASAAGPKVAIIVGPTAITDSQYQPWAEELADTATAAGATVDLRYCATPDEARAAANGANIVVYFGHGNGFPNPYSATENPNSVNGWGLRDPAKTWSGANCTDTVLRYYGENYLTGKTSGYGWTGGGITPAANFVMVYSNACYAPGAGEARPAPAESVAVSRVGNYSSPILELGGSYFATDLGSDRIVDLLLRNPTLPLGRIFELGNGYDATALHRHVHPSVDGAEAWVHRTDNRWLGDDYWYAFAGNPSRTFQGNVVSPPFLPAPASADVDRLAGTDRYETAAAISAASFAPGVAVAYVAVGGNFPDALAAGAAAARRGGPVLLVTPGGVPASTAAELARLRPSAIKVVGGAGVIGDGVLDALRPYATSGSVSRVAGDNRFATAAAISADTFAPGVPVAYVATGRNFPDALAGVAAAGSRGGPILLTAPSELSPETAAELARLRPASIVVLGGAGVVGDGVLAALRGYATTGSVSRLAGQDRYATSVAVSTGTFGAGQTVFVATGVNFPDALGGGPVAATVPGPLLLVPGSSLPTSVAAELQRLGPDRVVVLGGTGVVSDGVVAEIRALLGG